VKQTDDSRLPPTVGLLHHENRIGDPLQIR